MWKEIAHALHALVRDRGLTIPAVVLLALTLGTTAGIYAVVDAVLLRPLPFADQSRPSLSGNETSPTRRR